jgi:hypothetical protein
MDKVLRTTKTTRGTMAVIYEGFTFRMIKTLSTEEISWRCVNKMCKSSLKTKKDYTLSSGPKYKHNHAPPSARDVACTSLSLDSCRGSSPEAGTTIELLDTPPRVSTPNVIECRDTSLSLLLPDSQLCSENSFSGASLDQLTSLLKENDELKEKNSVLKDQWNAVVNRSLDLEFKLMALEDLDRVEVACQTEHNFLDSVPDLEVRR